MKQNYATIDTYRVSIGKYLKLSQINDDPQPHYVVAEYVEGGSEIMRDHCVGLENCWHFTGPTAAFDASSFFCSMIPELSEDSPFVPAANYPSYRQ